MKVGLAYSRARWLVCGVAMLLPLLGAQPSISGGPSVAASPQSEIRDFRKEPLGSKEEIRERNLIPSFDDAYLRTRLRDLLHTADLFNSNSALSDLDRVIPNRTLLSYHAVIRSEATYDPRGFVDLHIPKMDGSTKGVTENATVYGTAVDTTLTEITLVGGLRPQSDPSSTESAGAQKNAVLDRQHVNSRATEMWKGVGPSTSGPDMSPRAAMTYHVVVRLDDHRDESSGGHEAHFPAMDEAKEALPELLKKNFDVNYKPALLRSLNHYGDTCGLRQEKNEGRADVLIHINLAERASASTGFSFETMSLQPERRPELWTSVEEWARKPSVSQSIYVLPWTIIRLHHQFVGPKLQKAIVGAEVWLEYPTRSAWQEFVARQALRNPGFARTYGIGETRHEILSRFQVPSQLPLAPLNSALRGDVMKGDLPRPNETLLSFATDLLRHREDAIYETSDPLGPVNQGALQHSRMLSSHLGHALAVIVGSIRAGGMFVGPASGDFFSAFNANPSKFIAETALLRSRTWAESAADSAIATTLAEYVCGEAGKGKVMAAHPPGFSVDQVVRIEKAAIEIDQDKYGEQAVDPWGLNIPPADPNRN